MKLKLMWQAKQKSSVKDQPDTVLVRSFDKNECLRAVGDDKQRFVERCKVLS